MSATVNFVIRDGLAGDIAECLLLDHTYETDTVWQMQVNDEGGLNISFKDQRLPRELVTEYSSSEARLRGALVPDQCFLVATTRDSDPERIGYLAMRSDPHYGYGLVQDVVVSRPYRRHRIATRMLKIAAQWAKEQHLSSLMIETQTKNYPGIRFCEASGFAFCGFNDRYFANRDIAVFFSQPIR